MSRARNAYRTAGWHSINAPLRVVAPVEDVQAEAPSQLADEPAGLYDLRHGYTLDDLHRAARTATRTDWSHSAGDFTDRFDLAFGAVAVHLYAADQAPTPNDLVRAGREALSRAQMDDLRHHGITHRYEPAPNAYAYWALVQVVPSPADGVVDRVALWQIWPLLKEPERAALLALAAHGDYDAAAESLGLRYYTFTARVRRARLRFLELWHQGEAPSRPWGRDRRTGLRGVEMTTQRTAVRVIGRRRAAARRAAGAVA